jgi:exodeoxyribonuclease VII large subunit
VPVISGVGHESDWSISDLVADLRASTPTAAAEQSVPDGEELKSRLDFYVHQLNLDSYSLIDNFRNELDAKVGNLHRSLPDFVNQKIRLDDLIGRVNAGIGHTNELTKEFLNGLTQKMAALSPSATISRGYSVIQRTLDGKIINSVGDVGFEENIAITVSDGIINAKTVATKNGSEVPEEHQLNLL